MNIPLQNEIINRSNISSSEDMNENEAIHSHSYQTSSVARENECITRLTLIAASYLSTKEILLSYFTKFYYALCLFLYFYE